MINKTFKTIVLFFFITFFFVTNDKEAYSNALASSWHNYGQGKIRIIVGQYNLSNKELKLGLEFKLDPKWKIFWKEPGDAGYPMKVDWSNSINLNKKKLLWPLPTRFKYLDMYTNGYEKEVVFPILVSLKNSWQPILINMKIDFLTCADVCIPHSLQIKHSINQEIQTNNFEFDDKINFYYKKVPSLENKNFYWINSVKLIPRKNDQKIQVSVISDSDFQNPDIFVKNLDGFHFSPPTLKYLNNRKQVVFLVPVRRSNFNEKYTDTLIGKEIEFTIINASKGVEEIKKIELGGFNEAGSSSLSYFFLLALLGGLILNFMPCVLPVLSLKLLNVINNKNEDKKVTRINFIFNSLGIIVSFIALGVAVTLIQNAGKVVGWGFHFQEPIFNLAIIMLLTIFCANLLGFFEIRLPAIVNFWINSKNSAKIIHRNEYSHSFLAGVLATVLSTPCSAPIVGTTIGFALAGSVIETLTIFFALGFGMSIPYIFVAFFPSIVSFFPRPGSWIRFVKYFLAACLMLTVIWLLTIVSIQAGTQIAIIVGASSLSLLFFLFIGNASSLYKIIFRRIVPFSLVIFTAIVVINFSENTKSVNKLDPNWQDFEKDKIKLIINEGKVVLVDVTAEWCITCKVNKNLVLESKQVKSLLQTNTIVAMQADWTKKNKSISDYLFSFGRAGVPFNVVYGKHAPKGLVLPELLDTETVIRAINLVQGRKAILINE